MVRCAEVPTRWRERATEPEDAFVRETLAAWVTALGAPAALDPPQPKQADPLAPAQPGTIEGRDRLATQATTLWVLHHPWFLTQGANIARGGVSLVKKGPARFIGAVFEESEDDREELVRAILGRLKLAARGETVEQNDARLAELMRERQVRDEIADRVRREEAAAKVSRE